MSKPTEQNVKQLAIFKIDKVSSESDDDAMLFCGFANNESEVIKYMEDVQNQVHYKMQDQLAGEYLVLPSIYFNIKKR